MFLMSEWRKDQKKEMKEGVPVVVKDEDQGVFWKTEKILDSEKIDAPAYGVSLYNSDKEDFLVLEKRYILTDSLRESLESRIEASNFERDIQEDYGIASADEILLKYEVENDLRKNYGNPEKVLEYFEDKAEKLTPSYIALGKDFDTSFLID